MENFVKTTAFQKIINIFYKEKWIKIYFLIFFSTIAGLFEFFGLVLIYRFVLFLMGANVPYNAEILAFFKVYFNIKSTAVVSLVLGVSIALIYIAKNIFLLFYIKYYNKILTELSNRITFETIKIFLYQNYLEMKSVSDAQKLNLLEKIGTVVWSYCLRVINLYSNLITALILLSYLFIKFTAIAIPALVIIGILGGGEYLYLKKKSNYQNKNYSSALFKSNSLMLKAVTLIKEIKILSLEKFFMNEVEDKYKTLSKLNEDQSFNGVLHIYLTEILIMFSFIIVLCVLFYTSKFDNKIILGSLCTISVVILRLVPLINRMQSSLYVINSNQKITDEVLEFFEKYPLIKIKDEQKKQNIIFENEISFENLSFSYDKKIGLKNISLKIKKGEFIGIVGESGCYKTTLINILSGLIKPDKGKILIDNSELTLDNVKLWQNKISYIAQDHGLIFENILDNFSLFSSLPPDKKRICEIFSLLGLDRNILNMKESELSQGQKQRVSLAIAIYQNKEILLLDEITSCVDTIAQNKISELLNNLKGEKTIISIAHRLQVLANCDRIIFMDNARIIDFDTFENLDKKYPKFHKIVKLSGLKSIE